MEKLEPRRPFKYLSKIRKKLHEVVFGTETRAGRGFDVVLLYAIIISIVVVMLESVQELRSKYLELFLIIEWSFTILFTVEYLLRIWISHEPKKYAFSALGIIDLLALLPTFLSVFMTGGSYLMVIRAIRLLRVFRILKLTRYLDEAQSLREAMKSSVHKILIFMGAVSTLVIITGTLMYLIEGGENGFTSIPKSIYWAVVTVTTVGYGDIAPETILGQSFATILMLMGYAIIAVPTGIVTSEMTRQGKEEDRRNMKQCQKCKHFSPSNSNYCNICGTEF